MEPETPTGGYRNVLFDDYLETSYEALNDLSADGSRRAAERYDKYVGRHLPDDPETEILEVGCGAGAFLEYCAARGYRRVRGIDLSPDLVELCRRKGLDRVERADAASYLTRHAGSFGAIVLNDVLEHFRKDDVLPVLRSIRSALRPAGLLIVKVPNMSNPLNLRSRYVDFTHEVGFTLESLRQVLRASGFEVEAIHGTFEEHRGALARLLFDVALWKLFLWLYRGTFHLSQEVVRGKCLVASARRPAAASSTPEGRT